MKRILIINTGGTIGMEETPLGLQPAPGYLQKLLEEMNELRRVEIPEFEIIEYQPLLDSSNMNIDSWLHIARDIESNYDAFDGFVVLHGTDTMAYTASALAFMFQGLSKPVILTGAQLPLGQIRNDARENLKTSLLLATDERLKEVTIFFGEVLLRGCRATKTSATKLDAFESPNFRLLGEAETEIVIFQHRLWQHQETRFRLTPIHQVDIATFDIFPGMSLEILDNILKKPLKALILKSYGSGNGPANNPEFLKILRDATRTGTVIVNLSQCQHGSVVQTNYATGTALRDAGVVSGCDMTLEAAVAKLMFLLSNPPDDDTIENSVGKSLKGELSEAPAQVQLTAPVLTTPPQI